MKNIERLICQLILIFCCCFPVAVLTAQVFPGDANNNGEVDNVDLLYIGYAFGEYGPARLDNGTEFSSQQILLPWEQEFPNGLNYAFADTDGDGLVDMNDMLTVFINYGEINDPVTPIEFPTGLPDFDPSLSLETAAIPNQLTPGSVIQMPIYLGAEDLPIENITGIAFSIHYNEEVVEEISLNLNESWLNNDEAGSLFHFLVFPVVEEGVLDVALTRFGQEPVSGYGEIGVLSIVIEDDLLDLLPGQDDSLEVIVEFEEIFMLNQSFETVPVAADQVSLMLYHPGAITDIKEPSILNQVDVFPNPVYQLLQIEAPVEISAVRILNAHGQERLFQDVGNEYKTWLNTAGLPAGINLVQVYTEAGIAMRKVMVLK